MISTAPDAVAGRYVLRTTLGRGGMAEVFAAHDLVLDRAVAVKLIGAHLAQDSRVAARFRREARTAASLAHPNVVAVHDAGTHEDTPYLVMELLEGGTLADLLAQEGRLAAGRMRTILADVAAGLAAAHARGLVHRDVKPSNLLFTRDGLAKIGDFGIAGMAEATRSDGSALHGSVPYLAPEQARGAGTDARADVYALGCVVFEALTGTPPFVGETPAATVAMHLHRDPPSPGDVADGIPTEVADAVKRALAKDPAERFGSVTAFAAAVGASPPARVDGRAAAPTRPLGVTDATRAPLTGADATPAGRSGTGRGRWLAGAALAVLLLAVMAFVATRPEPADPSEDAAVASVPAAAPVTSPSPSPSPAPTPSPSVTPRPPTVQEAVDGVRAEIAAGRRAGHLTAHAVDELEKHLTKVVDRVDEAKKPEEIHKALDELRKTLGDLEDKGEVDGASADAIGARIDALAGAVDRAQGTSSARR